MVLFQPDKRRAVPDQQKILGLCPADRTSDDTSRAGSDHACTYRYLHDLSHVHLCRSRAVYLGLYHRDSADVCDKRRGTGLAALVQRKACRRGQGAHKGKEPAAHGRRLLHDDDLHRRIAGGREDPVRKAVSRVHVGDTARGARDSVPVFLHKLCQPGTFP